MQQKQRNKIAWGLIIAFVPLLIYLLVTKVGKEPAATTANGQIGTSPSPGMEIVPPGTGVQPPARSAPAVAQKVLAEQKRITALLPKNNPFNPSRSVIVDQPPITTVPATTAPPVTHAPPSATDAGIKLTAIVSRQGSAARMAMINGRFYGEGDHIANWTIIKVNPRDIVLQDGARQMILRLK